MLKIPSDDELCPYDYEPIKFLCLEAIRNFTDEERIRWFHGVNDD
jgi:hypothetical protein